ncbi:TetR/AcrR family transcriptional regulator [Mycobacterium sp. MS1601]|uniref:TetR/AcrR family transcriptional regulator n=1 Tax=Mycobacterium sp. MS1601 TaxID=1936029 RepID=UPI001F162785|nr:TetR/AcrR family transcriptional regulator [Mycobacterium sp. MS1601]
MHSAHVLDRAVTESRDSGTETAREQILRAATRQFARRSYHLVSLDDILGDAAVTKGAMYFHFTSKYALALAIIDRYIELCNETLAEQLRLQRSGLETLIDVSYQMAVQDLTLDTAKAGIHLTEAVGRTDGLQTKRIADLTTALGEILGRAVEEGDVAPDRDPAQVSHLLVSLYAGLRQTTGLDDGPALLAHVQSSWSLVLPGFVVPDRVGYFTQLVRRRTRVALAKVNHLG